MFGCIEVGARVQELQTLANNPFSGPVTVLGVDDFVIETTEGWFHRDDLMVIEEARPEILTGIVNQRLDAAGPAKRHVLEDVVATEDVEFFLL